VVTHGVRSYRQTPRPTEKEPVLNVMSNEGIGVGREVEVPFRQPRGEIVDTHRPWRIAATTGIDLIGSPERPGAAQPKVKAQRRIPVQGVRTT